MEVCLETYLSNATPFLEHIYQCDTSAADDCNCSGDEGPCSCIKVFIDSDDFSLKLRNVAHWFVKRMDEINRARAVKRTKERTAVGHRVDEYEYLDARQLYILGAAIRRANDTEHLKVPQYWKEKCTTCDEDRRNTMVSRMKMSNIQIELVAVG